jgi:D-glycero-D-manno-heptose 1,7-bisphosphate phosphatase
VSKLVILDRDGTVNFDSPDYVRTVEGFVPIPGSLEAIARLCRAGYQVAIATNQSGLGRGYFDMVTLVAMHQKLNNLLAPLGGRIAHFAVCPHRPDADCVCRKPRPGLLDQIAKHFGISLKLVPIIGDSRRDLEAATTVGGRGILVRTGNGADAAAALGDAVEVYDDLAAAVDALLREDVAAVDDAPSAE